MKPTLAVAVFLCCAAGTAAAQKPASAFDRGHGQQAWQNPGYAAVAAKCKTPPTPPRIGGGAAPASTAAPPPPGLPMPKAIPGVLAAGQSWKVVWAWEGNNVDGPIAADDGSVLFANNDAGNVMKMDPATGLATVVFDHTNTGGALSRSKNGALFLAVRGLGGGIEQLEPQRRMFANTFNGEPLECAGGVVNDLMADARGGVYLAISGAGVFYANPQGVMTKYGNVPAANGIILSPDEKTLYVTNGGTLVAFDVQADGSLANQRDFGKLEGGQNGDGSAVDAEGRVYVATGASADVFSPKGEFLGSIAGPQGMHGVFIGGKDKKTLYGIVFYGGWGTPSARNQIVAIPLLAQGYTGRAK
ncbi:MAG TPA: SMP-30/gluconolactonase/LRE family protein [Gammaproteobacteria bacterium]|jgi:gluconolactonase|nr:SMP-30/gluconolactonase/LRE family protein [Gammaproteobacteria bacterium]